MKLKHKKLVREQLDDTLRRFEVIRLVTPPAKGWIRAIRDALGMSGRQLAGRMKVNQQRVARIERDETLGKVTLHTMRQAAEAMDCIFVYGFVPKSSLEQTIRTQAERVAKKQILRSNQMMRLEDQELGEKEKQRMLDNLTEEIVQTMPKLLWDHV